MTRPADHSIPRTTCPARLWVYAAAGILGLLVASAATLPPRHAPAAPDPGPAAPAQPAPSASSMDEPLRLIAAARQAFQGVRDYTCVMIKRERLKGQLQPDNIVEMKVRNQPFSVYLRWLQPKGLAGQQACYVAGRNNGMMRVHLTGLRGAAGWLSIDPRDPRARESSNHTITEAGIGNLIERCSRAWQAEKQMNVSKVRVGEYEYNNRRCTRVETIHPEKKDGRFQSYRTVFYFDNETHLPIRTEMYDWPRPGNPDGDLLEVYSYINMRLNVGLGDESFNY
ncbi:MAG TPA: DUF1571 domain-containing protein [Gemmataceae bacterium]|nr:DUF1571 domain-containing protein [Gemmataceae bacterium]